MKTFLVNLMQRLAGGEAASDMITVDGEIAVSLEEDAASSLVWAYASPGYLRNANDFAQAGECWSATPQPDPAVPDGVRTLHIETQSGMVLLAHAWPHSALTVETFREGISGFAACWRGWASRLADQPIGQV